MPVPVTLDQIAALAPNARSAYRDAFGAGQPELARFGITDTPLRIAHFMAQMLHETGGLSIQFEGLNYSAERLPIVWPKRFKPRGPLDPAAFAHNAEALANEVYGGRMGNTTPGDGFKFRGRGLLQLTGRESYAQATTILRASFPTVPDFTVDPDAVIGAEWCLKVAAAEWSAKKCNAMADRDDVDAVSIAINGGEVGLDERKEWLKKTKFVWH